MKRLTLLLLTLQAYGFAQSNALSLDSCLQMAKRNYPLIKQNALIAENEKNNKSNDNKSWLPKLSFVSNATYQTEVIEIPGMVVLPHDSYVGALALEQNVFDGGQINAQKRLDRVTGENELQKNAVELYKLVDRVTQVYGGILLSRENLKTLNVYKNDIVNKKSILSASFKNGMVLQSNVDALEAAELQTDQNIEEAKENIRAYYKTLSMFINQPVDDSTKLMTLPVSSASKGEEISRPEMKAFETQKAVLDARHQLNNSFALPRLTIGGQYSYGRPGPNFLNQDPRFFGQASLSLKWNIAALYSLHNEKQNINIGKKMLDVQRETFEFNIKSAMLTQTAQINALQTSIEKDKLIIEKRHNITLTASKQLENGSITSTDYLIELNAEMQAILNQKIHEVRLMNAITSYNSSKGINNF
jgi:outer membrane protein TolC